MNTLSDYFRLKEYDRIEAEKKCLVTLKKVMDVCLKKGFSFSVNTQTNGISVHENDFKWTLDAYFKGDLINYSDNNNTCTIFEMLQQLNKK